MTAIGWTLGFWATANFYHFKSDLSGAKFYRFKACGRKTFTARGKIRFGALRAHTEQLSAHTHTLRILREVLKR